MALLSILQRAALALPVAAIVAAFVASAVHVDGADDNNNDPRSPPSAKRKKVRAKFVNQLPDAAVELFWEDHRGGDRRLEGRLRPRGGWHVSNTFAGHEFSYVVRGVRHYVTVGPGNMFGETLILTAGDVDGIRVRCDVSTNSRETWEGLDVLVKPYWSHGGASRFLDLVRSGHYDGSAFHRAVPSLVTQFGIARDHAVRTRERSIAVRDDHDRGRVIKFEPGYLSFAGSGADSRSTEVFVVNPGVGEAELGRFGDNSWETPFGHLIGDVDDGPLTRIYSGYGDMFPFGNGPDPNRIYDVDGYTAYIPREFPKLDYIERCYIVNEVGIDSGMSEGEL